MGCVHARGVLIYLFIRESTWLDHRVKLDNNEYIKFYRHMDLIVTLFMSHSPKVVKSQITVFPTTFFVCILPQLSSFCRISARSPRGNVNTHKFIIISTFYTLPFYNLHYRNPYYSNPVYSIPTNANLVIGHVRDGGRV